MKPSNFGVSVPKNLDCKFCNHLGECELHHNNGNYRPAWASKSPFVLGCLDFEMVQMSGEE